MPKGPMSEEHKAKLAEGRRRAWEKKRQLEEDQKFLSKNISLPSDPGDPNKSVEVVYRPFDGDPHTAKWNGIVFRANVPVTLDRSNRAHHIEQLLPRQYAGTNGETLTKHVPTHVFMGDLAKGNPSFEVDGHRIPRRINSRVVPAPGQEWTEAHEGQISESYQRDDSVAA